MTEITTPAGQALLELGIPFQEFIHKGPLASLAQAAAERDQSTDQVIRSLLFRVKEGVYMMALVAGEAKVSWKALRKYYKQNRLSMPGPEEVLQITGYEIGSVTPFGMKASMDILIDTSVTRQREVSMGSGVRGTGIILQVNDLLKALDFPPEVDIVSD
jgi:Cys-tRNA(Pro) deacylase